MIEQEFTGKKYRANSRQFSNKFRKFINEKCSNECFYCYIPLKEMIENNSYTIDHLLPRTKGGTDDISNLVLSCRSCNSKKGTLSYNGLIKSNKIKNTKRYQKYLKEHEYFTSLLRDIRKNEI